jgi:hypothetical protein
MLEQLVKNMQKTLIPSMILIQTDQTENRYRTISKTRMCIT